MFKWLESYSVGVPLFDTQHQKLFELANQLFFSLQSSEEHDARDLKVDQIISELIRYTQYHFSQEEKMMQLYHYPDFENHLKEHHIFVDFLNEFDYDDIAFNPEKVGRELLLKLVEWITHHIQATDKKYSSFLMSSLTKQ